MNPRLYNSSGVLVAVLDNIIKTSAKIKRVINGEFTFSYDAHESALKSEYFQPHNYVVIDSQTFDLKYVELLHEDGLTYTIEAEHALYRLQDGESNELDGYTFLGTPTEILTDLLSGTDFSVGTIAYTEIITLSINETITRKEAITYLANYLGGELDFRDLGFTIDILDTIGLNNGFEARFGRNLVGLTKIINGRDDELDTYYKVDLYSLKNSTGYSADLLGGLELLGVGDTIKIIDDVTGLNVENRILSIQYNPVLEFATRLEIANKIELLTDAITDIETSVVYKDKEYNKVSISNEYGFRSELASKLARTTMGANSISMDKGDGEGNYTPVVYFDINEQTYIFDGLLSATAIEAVSANIDVVVSNTIITQNLYSSFGRIANLTVSELDTSFQKILNRKYELTTDVRYRKIYEDRIELWIATTDGSQQEPYMNTNDELLYWTDATQTEMTTVPSDTTEPIYVYIYDEVIKWEQGTEIVDGTYIPYQLEGAGDDVLPLSGKTKHWKGLDGYYIEYYKLSTGEPVTLKIGENGIELNGTSVFKQPEIPTEATEGAIWFDDDDRSTQDVQTFLADGVIDVSKGQIIDGSGTISIELYSLLDESNKSVHPSPVYELTILNTGAGMLTITAYSGETIEGSSTLTVSSGSRKRLIGYGTDWKVI